jgi:hypothetical protein
MGLFSWLLRKSNPRAGPPATTIEEVAQRLAEAWDAHTVIDRLDDVANQILKAHGFDSWPCLVPAPEHIQAATGYPTLPVWSMPEGTPEKAQHAARLLEALRLVRSLLYSDSKLNDAVVLGMRLGIAVEQAGLADLVPLAKRQVRLSRAGQEWHSECIQVLQEDCREPSPIEAETSGVV